MKRFQIHSLAFLFGAFCLVPMLPPTARADDDWEDRYEEWREDREDAREEAEERWEERREEWEDRHDDRVIVRRHRGYVPYDGYRRFKYSPRRYYRYDREPVYRSYYRGPRVYRDYDHYYHDSPRHYYGGNVHAGPADVHYGRHGSVRVGPLSFYW